jgi:hypothetical protein
MAAKVSKKLGLTSHVAFSGPSLWHTFYPWPKRPKGLLEQGFAEIEKRWLTIFDHFDKAAVDVCFELYPGEDLHDGVPRERC